MQRPVFLCWKPRPNFFWQRLTIGSHQVQFCYRYPTYPDHLFHYLYIYILIYISLQTAHLHVDKGSHWRDLVSFRKLPVRILPLTWETGHLKNWTICFDCRMRCWGWGRWSGVLEGQLKQGFDMFQSWVINKTLSVSRRLLSNLMTNIMVFKADQNYFFVEITWYLLGGKFTRPII